MGFLAPLMLLGVLALAVPIAIHLIGRRRARIVKFAALDFLLATKRRTARRFRLRERVLLIVRVIACAALALALAKPYMSCARKGPEVSRGPQAAVIVIDDSFASSYLVNGTPWIKSATDEARRLLARRAPTRREERDVDAGQVRRRDVLHDDVGAAPRQRRPGRPCRGEVADRRHGEAPLVEDAAHNAADLTRRADDRDREPCAHRQRPVPP